jgi:hypothetical protein
VTVKKELEQFGLGNVWSKAQESDRNVQRRISTRVVVVVAERIWNGI